MSNSTTNDLVFEVEKEDVKHGDFFTCDSSISVPHESTAYLPVTFKPDWIYKKCKAVISITNPATKEKFEFELKGKSEEPLAEDHIQFNCNVGDSYFKLITIPNNTEDRVAYTVKMDLHGLTGEEYFTVKKKSYYSYKLMMTPSLGGIYAGSITFTNEETGNYIWYSLEMEAKGLRNIADYEVSSTVRKPAELEIEVENKHSVELDYSVYIQGNYLYGDSKFKVPGNTKYIYKLVYVPLSLEPGEASVSFSNSKAGELLCRVHMKAIDVKPQRFHCSNPKLENTLLKM